MNTLELNTEIFLTTHRQMLPTFFMITKITEKAIQLRNKIWLPKSALIYDDDLRCFYLKPWFRSKMENWQISFLQS